MSTRSRTRRTDRNPHAYLEFLEARCLLSGTAPTVTDITRSLGHNTVLKFSQVDFTSHFSDPESDPIQFIEFTSLPTFGTLKFGSAPVYAFEHFKFADIAKLTFTPNTNFAGQDSFSWSAYDGTDFAQQVGSYIINVAATAPTISPINKGVKQNNSLTFEPNDFIYSFNETNLGPNLTRIKITALPTHGSLTLNGVAVTLNQIIEADNNGTLTQKVGTLVYTPTSGYTGPDTIGWNGSDGFNFAKTNSVINLTVVPAVGIIVTGNNMVIPNGALTTARNANTNFGPMSLSNTFDGQFCTRTFTLTNNTGGSITLPGAPVFISGVNPTDFSVSQQASAVSLANGQSATFTVKFTPLAAGVRNAVVHIPNSLGADFTFAVSGTGVITSNASNGLQVAQTAVGTGTATAILGSVLTMQYTGYLMTGLKFDSSLNLDRTPFQFTMGIGEVISGWDNGLFGIKVGEKRLLIIPAASAYGANGQGNIPGNATLIFEVQCLSIGLPQVGVLSPNSPTSVLVTPGATTASTDDLTNLGTLSFNQANTTQTFGIYGVGYKTPDGQHNSIWYYPQGDPADTDPTDGTTAIAVTLTGPNASDFTLTHAPQNTFSIVDGDQFTVQFNRPSTPGTRTATISVLTNDPFRPTLTFTVSGTAAPFVDYVPSIGNTLALPGGNINTGSRTSITLPLSVLNQGNSVPTANNTNINIEIYAHDTTTAEETLLTTFLNQSMSGIGVNQSKAFNLTFQLPIGFPEGNFKFVAKVVQPSTNTLAESNTDNNLVATSQTITTVLGANDPTQLEFTQQPGNVTAGVAISPSIAVAVKDQFGGLVTPTSPVTLSILSGPAGGKIIGTATANVVNGVATFSGISFTVAGDYILQATDGLITTNSQLFTVAPAAATKLLITTQPAATLVAGVSPTIVVKLVDAFGNTVDTTAPVVAAFSKFPAGAILGGTTVVNAANGIATFSGLLLTKVGAYNLKFTSGALTLATTTTVNVTPAAASQLQFSTQPLLAVAGVNLKPFSVKVLDAFGNLVTAATNITVAVNTGPGSTINGTLTVQSSNGVATFSAVSLVASGTYTLKATGSSLTDGVSNSFNINPAIGASLQFIQQPSDADAGANIAPAITVKLLDQFGNLATTDKSSVTLKILTGPTGGKLFGTFTAKAIGGIATFSALNIQMAGTYTLQAIDGTKTPTNSNSFFIAPLAANHMTFSPIPSTTTNTNFDVVVNMLDRFNNVAVSDSSEVTLAINTSPLHAIMSGSPTAIANNGIVTFNNMQLDTVGSYTLKATTTTPGILAVTSAPVVITAGATPTVGVFATQPNASETNPTTTGKGIFTVSLDAKSVAPIVVKFTLGGGATFTDDYSLSVPAGVTLNVVGNDGTLTIPANALSVAVSLIPVADNVPGVEIATLTLNSDAAYAITPTKTSADINISVNAVAPVTLAGRVLNATITSGTAPLESTGKFQLVLSANSDRYVFLGTSPVGNATGTYTYTRLTAHVGQLTFTDTNGTSGTVTLTFSTATAMTFTNVLTSGPGTQAGTMTLAAVPATGLAPLAIDSLNIAGTVSSGAAPFASSGSFVMLPASDTYTLTGTGAVQSSTGSYDYEPFTPTIGVIRFTDSVLGEAWGVFTFTSVSKANFLFVSTSNEATQKGTIIVT